jgi:hypothetical protein
LCLSEDKPAGEEIERVANLYATQFQQKHDGIDEQRWKALGLASKLDESQIPKKESLNQGLLKQRTDEKDKLEHFLNRQIEFFNFYKSPREFAILRLTIQEELKNNSSIKVVGGIPKDWSKLTFTDLVTISFNNPRAVPNLDNFLKEYSAAISTGCSISNLTEIIENSYTAAAAEFFLQKFQNSQATPTPSIGPGGSSADAAAAVQGTQRLIRSQQKQAVKNLAPKVQKAAKNLFADKALYQEQCFLLSQVGRLLEIKNKAPQRLPYIEDGINKNAPLSVFDEPFGFMNRMTQASHSYNLFNFTTDQLSALVPTIRLYKVMTSPTTGKDLGFVEIKFDTNPAINSYSSKEGPKSALDLFRSSDKRGVGVGLKDFNFTLHGSNPFATKKAIQAKVSIFATSFGDLIKQRIGEVVSVDGEKTPRGLDKNYKFADLALKTGKTPEELRTNLSSIQKDNLDKLNFRLKVVVGWAIPTESSDLFNPIDRQAINDSFMNLNLTPTTHEFSFDEMGGVTFNINYLAYIEDYFNNSMFNIFSDKEVDGSRMARRMLYDYLENFNCDSGDINKIKEADAQFIQLERVKSFRRLFSDLVIQNRILYYNLSYTEIGEFIRTGKPPPGTDLEPKLDGQINTTDIGNQFKTLTANLNNAGVTDPETLRKFKVSLYSTSREKNKISFFFVSDLIDLIMRNIDESLEELSQEANKDSGAIFNYTNKLSGVIEAGLKEKIDGYFEKGKQNPAIYKEIQKLRKAKEQFKKLRIVLGPIEIKDPFDNTKTYPCTIGDIPITLNYLTDFLTERKLSKDESVYSISSFIKDLTNDLIKNFLNTDSCFSFNTKQKIKLNSATVSCFNRSANNTGSDDITYFITNPNFRKALGRRNVLQLYNNSDKVTDNNGIKQPVLLVSGPSRHPLQLLQAHREINYQIFYAGRAYPANFMSGDAIEDQRNGIFHYILGKDKGLIKNISLDRTDMPGLKELRFEQEGFDGLTQLREVYNANISCLLNLHTFPGTYIYIDPRGFSPEADINYTQFGIGGYYMITRSEHSIGPGKADTTIVAKWVAHASKEVEASNRDAGIVSQNEQAPRKCVAAKRSSSFIDRFSQAVVIDDLQGLGLAIADPLSFALQAAFDINRKQ